MGIKAAPGSESIHLRYLIILWEGSLKGLAGFGMIQALPLL
jgi:hypothetical protein